MIKKVSTEKAPAALGPYSQAVIAGDFLFSSGQIAIQPETGSIIGETIAQQAERVMENLKAVLEEANVSFAQVVKTTCFLADMNDFAAFNQVYGEYFPNKPARSCVEVRRLPKDVLCEVEVVAYLK